MALFDMIKVEHHICGMDNVHNSDIVCKKAFNHLWKVLDHGVKRKGMRWIRVFVIQGEAKSEEQQLEIKGTVKISFLQGDPNCPDIIATSM